MPFQTNIGTSSKIQIMQKLCCIVTDNINVTDKISVTSHAPQGLKAQIQRFHFFSSCQDTPHRLHRCPVATYAACTNGYPKPWWSSNFSFKVPWLEGLSKRHRAIAGTRMHLDLLHRREVKLEELMSKGRSIPSSLVYSLGSWGYSILCKSRGSKNYLN